MTRSFCLTRGVAPGLLTAAILGLTACDDGDLPRMLDKSQGTLSVAPGMPMKDVLRRSTLKLHKLPSLGTSVNYATGSAYFDFELPNSALRFHGCSMYSIDAEGPEESVTSIDVYITPSHLRWGAFTRELKDTAAKLKADGWKPHVSKGRPNLESFVSQDGSKVGTTPSDVVAVFDWSKGPARFQLSAHRAWDGPRYWSSFGLSEEAWLAQTERWLSEFPAYPGARTLCSQHVTGGNGTQRREIAWSMYATKVRESDVFSFYSAYANWQGMKSDLVDSTLILVGADGTKRLSIHDASRSHPDCGVRPQSDDRTVVIVSQALPENPSADGSPAP